VDGDLAAVRWIVHAPKLLVREGLGAGSSAADITPPVAASLIQSRRADLLAHGLAHRSGRSTTTLGIWMAGRGEIV